MKEGDCKEKIVKKKKLSKQRKNKFIDENAHLKRKYELQQVEYYKLESEFESLEIKYQTTVQEKEEIRKTSETYQMKNKELKGRLEDSISIYNETDKQWQQSCLKYKRLEKEFEAHKKKYRRLMEKNTEQEYTIRDYRKKDCLLFNLRRKVALQESEIKSSHEMLEEYKSKNLELENKLKECLLTEGDLKMMVKNLKRKLENCESHIDVARETVDNLLKRRGSRIYERDQQIQESSSSDDSSCDVSEDAVTSHDEDNKSMSAGTLHSGSSTPEEEQQNKKRAFVPDMDLTRPKFADQYKTEGNMPPSARPPFRLSYNSVPEKYAKMKLPGDEMFKKLKLDMEVENRNRQRGSRFMTPGNDEETKIENFKKLLESRQKKLRAQFAKLKH